MTRPGNPAADPATAASQTSGAAVRDSTQLSTPADPSAGSSAEAAPDRPKEIGGRVGPDPTRYGDWELKGRCIDF